jgi:hypothetical protein
MYNEEYIFWFNRVENYELIEALLDPFLKSASNGCQVITTNDSTDEI